MGPTASGIKFCAKREKEDDKQTTQTETNLLNLKVTSTFNKNWCTHISDWTVQYKAMDGSFIVNLWTAEVSDDTY